VYGAPYFKNTVLSHNDESVAQRLAILKSVVEGYANVAVHLEETSLLYLVWHALKPGGKSAFCVKDLPIDTPAKLFMMGFITNVANPKIAIMYLSLLPQFIQPGHGSLLGQSLALGCVQIAISLMVNGMIVIAAGSIAGFLSGRPAWIKIQRWLMGTVLAGLALKIAFEAKR
jgi:threonine/homoserine/homoserine lactone efflux protein